jgi:replicative DNA helicase
VLTEQRTLPHSEETERAVLGAILLDPELLAVVSRRLTTEDFYLLRHQGIFSAMCQVRDDGGRVDLRTLQATLERWGHFEEVGGIAYLAALDLDLPDLGHVGAYVEIVKERSVRRQLVEGANRLIRASLWGEPLPEVVEAQTQALETARRALGGSGAGGYRHIREAILRATEILEDTEGGTVAEKAKSVVTTGITRLDARFALEIGTLVFVGGLPGQGKTALLWQIAEHNAVAGRGVAIQSLEMSAQALALRAICHHGEVAKTDLTNAGAGRGTLTAQQWRRVVQAARQLADLPVYLDTTRVLTAPDIAARLRRLKDEHPEIAVVELDYFTLMSLEHLPGVDPRAPKHERAGAGVRYLRNLFGELEVVGLVGAQVVRDVAKTSRRPIAPDLRDAGEQDADAIVFVHREPREDDSAKLQNRGDLILAKAREGEPGSVPILFDGSGQRFTEPSSEEIEAERAAARAKRKPKSYERNDD